MSLLRRLRLCWMCRDEIAAFEDYRGRKVGYRCIREALR